MSTQVYLSTCPRKNWLRFVPFFANDLCPLDEPRIVHEKRPTSPLMMFLVS